MPFEKGNRNSNGRESGTKSFCQSTLYVSEKVYDSLRVGDFFYPAFPYELKDDDSKITTQGGLLEHVILKNKKPKNTVEEEGK